MKYSLSAKVVVVVAVLAVLGIIWFLPSLTSFDRTPVADKVPLAERTKSILGVELEALQNSLALTPVITGEEPFILTYSISFDMEEIIGSHISKGLNARRLWLELLEDGKSPGGYEFVRQKDGTYHVVWNTMFASFGSNTLQVCLVYGLPNQRLRVLGPPRTEYVTNLVQFDPYNTSFGSRARIYGILQVPSAEYKIEIFGMNLTLLRTITGATDKGLIDEVWNLKTEEGQECADEKFEAKVYIRPILSDTNNPTGTNIAPFSGPYPYYLCRIGKGGVGISQ